MDKQIREYLDKNWCIIPVPYKSKRPAIKWAKYQTEHPTEDEAEEWFGNEHQTNVALVCGQISGNGDNWHVVLDVDSLEGYTELKSKIEEKLHTDNLDDFTPVVRANRGYHIHFLVKEDVKSYNFPNLEIKSDGALALLPPSCNEHGRAYEWLNPLITSPFIINSLKDIGIDVNLEKPKAPGGDNWISEALEGVPAGQRDTTGVKLAGYFLRQRIPPDVVKTMLYPFAEKCDQSPEPFTNKDIDRIVDSVSRKENTKTNPSYGVDNTIINILPEKGDSLNSERLRNDFGTTSERGWGELSKGFDEFMREEGDGWQDKRNVAEQLGTTHKDRAFRKLLQKRRGDGDIRIHGSNPYLIRRVNRDYAIVKLGAVEARPLLDIKLPLNLHELVQIPPGSLIGVAGYPSAGKTAFLLEAAELNVLSQPMPVYYWFNEMSKEKLNIRCEDFPLLVKAQKEGKFFPVIQEDFEFADVLQADAINLVDYLDRDDELWKIAGDIRGLQRGPNRGIVIFALQKQKDSKTGYGGLPTLKRPNLYLTLDEKHQEAKAMRGKARIVKCKDWDKINPVGMSCEYLTGGKHGKLFITGIWGKGV